MPLKQSIVDFGLYTLAMMPLDFMSIVIYMTDGVSSNFGEHISIDTCRAYNRDYINFSIIQIGSNSGFTPTVSLGYIPNQEDVRFLADALNGTFVYAEDCPYIDDETVDGNPNPYHLLFSMRLNKVNRPNEEYSTFKNFSDKPRTVDTVRSKFINTTAESNQEISTRELSFPWHFDSQPPFIAEILCSYRNYKLPKIALSQND